MEDIIKNVKTSSMFNETEHLIKEMIETIGKIRQNRETNSSSVREQKRIIENQIQALNILDVFTFFIMSSMITTFLQSL
jgi:benzoyl-CoA reductase/2-hydroxyglutaryl-CoA dehydratase subunit BcrC/BadD/HgdB